MMMITVTVPMYGDDDGDEMTDDDGTVTTSLTVRHDSTVCLDDQDSLQYRRYSLISGSGWWWWPGGSIERRISPDRSGSVWIDRDPDRQIVSSRGTRMTVDGTVR